ncbi:MAG: biopolymer transporter ExbD [Pseudomonadota bacterium]
MSLDLELNITALLDIITILLFFLIRYYSSSNLNVELQNNVDVPDSKTKSLGVNSLVIQVNKDMKVWLNDTQIGQITGPGEKVDFLLAELAKVKKEEDAQGRQVASAENKIKDDHKNINLIFDKSLNYSVIRQVMHTAALAGYPQFKFIVRGD